MSHQIVVIVYIIYKVLAIIYSCYIITQSKAKPERSGDAKLEGLT